MVFPHHAYGTSSPIRSSIARMLKSGQSRTRIVSYSILSILFWKSLIGLGSYSGHRSPPLFGDLEAQRHWMALTVQIDPIRWYSFDLQYWGLDYPPLTAYHSLLLGYLARIINPTFILLRPPSTIDLDGWGDRLHEGLKVFLRSTVLISELLIWIPVVTIYHLKTFDLRNHSSHQKSIGHPSSLPNLESHHLSDRLWLGAMYSIITLLLNPNLTLIDNGHFQFNSIMLGFTLASLTYFHSGRDLLGAVMFICSVSFKQMALYYSPAIFAYLFGKCLYLGHPNGTKLFIRLALVSVATTLVLFGPFILFDSNFPQVIVQVIRRIFPIGRGLFEDKVGNFWCTLNLLIKIRALGTAQSLANLALLVTLGAILPGTLIVIILSWKLAQARSSSSPPNPVVPKTIELLPFLLYNSSIGFYLFSFQVHEKSILLAVLPLLLILSSHQKSRRREHHDVPILDWHIICLISNVSVFSMWPLLRRDGLALQYFVSVLSYNHMMGYNPLSLVQSPTDNLLCLGILAIYLTMIGIHLMEQLVKPPSRLPDLYVVMNLALSFAVFGASYLWSLMRLYTQAWTLSGFITHEDRQPVDHDQYTRLSKAGNVGLMTNLMEEDDGRIQRSDVARDNEERLGVKLPAKRSASLQQHRSTNKPALDSESESEEFKTRSVGATTDRAKVGKLTKRMLKDPNGGRSGSGSKLMISSPSGEKLMNRIKNRLQLEASRSTGHHSNHRRSSSPSNLSDRRRLSSEIRVTEVERDSDHRGQERETRRTSSGPKSQTDHETSDTEKETMSSFGRNGQVVPEAVGRTSSSTWEEDEEVSDQPQPRPESAWEIALRQSREEAIRRRREELLSARNLKKRLP